MNIGLLTPYYPDEHTINSGLANHFETLALALVAQGHCVTVIHVTPALGTETSRFENHTAQGISILTYKIALPGWITKSLESKWALINLLLRFKGMWTVVMRLNTIVKSHQLDVIEATSYFSLTYLHLLLRKQLVPVALRVSTTYNQIITDHYPFKSRMLDLLGSFEIALIRKSRYRLTHARNHARELCKLYDIPFETFYIIPHGIKMPVISDNAPHSGSPLKILYVGRMEYRKGIDTLLEAIPLVVQKNSNVLFELIGHDADGSYQKEFSAKHTDQINQKVLFRGNLDKAATQRAYAECDIFVAPSRYESFGLIYIEAMSYGKPAIGCNVGGVTDVITDGVNGLLCTLEDKEDLANKITLLLNDPEKRHSMGQAAINTVNELYTDERMATNSVRYYQTIIADSA